VGSKGSFDQRDLPQYAGLCERCKFARVLRSDRGSVFLQCGKSFEDAAFDKYPRLPVLACTGYEPIAPPL